MAIGVEIQAEIDQSLADAKYSLADLADPADSARFTRTALICILCGPLFFSVILRVIISFLKILTQRALSVRVEILLRSIDHFRNSKLQNCKTAKLQNCRTAEPQNCRTAELQNRRTSKLLCAISYTTCNETIQDINILKTF